MTARTIESEGRQAELEARALRMRATDPGRESDVKAVFGAAPEWIMEIGSFRLLLIPFLGEWWFYDDIHGEWRFTGKKIGETRFVVRDGGVRMLDPPATEASVVTSAPTQETKQEPKQAPQQPPAPQPPQPQAAPVIRFCSACGASVQPQWKFCQKCGAKLLKPA